MKNEQIRAGYVAIVGRPNVGKSTLLNQFLKQKVSITSKKRQTTRHNIIGIKTDNDVQIAFVDTPGMHQGQDNAINRYMNRTAESALQDVDAIVFVVDKMQWTSEDQAVANQVKKMRVPVVIAINKLDQLEHMNVLLPYVEELSKKLPGADIVPVSALSAEKVASLEGVIRDLMPLSQGYIFPEDQVTDKSMRFLAAEIVREKIVRQTGAELPYQTTVEIEEFKEEGELVTISALILVEREGQKRIVIGERGSRMKQIASDSRRDIEGLVGCKVMLNIWVKVKSGWSDDERALRSLGFPE